MKMNVTTRKSEATRYTIGGIVYTAIVLLGFVGYLAISFAIAQTFTGPRVKGLPVLLYFLSVCFVLFLSTQLASRVRKSIIGGGH